MITFLSLGLRPSKSGQLLPIIPQNHGLTNTHMSSESKNSGMEQLYVSHV